MVALISTTATARNKEFDRPKKPKKWSCGTHCRKIPTVICETTTWSNRICGFDGNLKVRANARNIVGQQDATLLGPTCCESLHTMLCVVACCCDLLEVWNWSNFRANKCQHFYCFAVIEAWSNIVAFVCTAHPTMLRRCTRTTCPVSTQKDANKK